MSAHSKTLFATSMSTIGTNLGEISADGDRNVTRTNFLVYKSKIYKRIQYIVSAVNSIDTTHFLLQVFMTDVRAAL